MAVSAEIRSGSRWAEKATVLPSGEMSNPSTLKLSLVVIWRGSPGAPWASAEGRVIFQSCTML